MSCLVHGLRGVWCPFRGWDIDTLGNTLSGCVTQDPTVGPSGTCAIHPTHPVRLVACTSEPQCCACWLEHKWINEGLRSLWANQKNVLLVSARVEQMYLLAAVAVMQLHRRYAMLTLLWKLLSYAIGLWKTSGFSQVRGCIQCLWVWSLSFAVLQVCVWSVDTCCVHTQNSLSVFITLGTAVLSSVHSSWSGCSVVKITF